ncbi:hypothetical protein OC846_002930 [Tilletia horrida]|uniref:NmrA-like domain-containing protein n=1 Tax=Tilletia horrida TaxID=155126 RepID=A0AAN6GQJ6_9BASI|nr:hypothetical protein OC846_002930 [Tilletia horrida]KAK0552991.1 hypothetical protein OC845_001410 [Tilletia horrida]KAK0566889.1 hypothetical protein OC861_003011 [Tilletia horrida]
MSPTALQENKPLVAVVAATGSQGTASIQGLCHSGLFRVRALVRDAGSERTQAMLKTVQDAKVQPEIVVAHLNQPETLSKAFAGVDAVYAYTTPGDGEDEVTLGRNIVDACAANDVKWLIWSSTPDSVEISKGKYQIDAYDDKVKIEKYIESRGIQATYVYFGAFFENILKYHYIHTTPSPTEHGEVDIGIAAPIHAVDKPSEWTSVDHDLGPIVTALAAAGLGLLPGISADKVLYRHNVTCTGYLSWQEMEDTMRKVLGRRVTHKVLTEDELQKIGLDYAVKIFKLADEFDPFQRTAGVPDPLVADLLKQTQQFIGNGDVKDAIALDDFESWARRNLVPYIANAEADLAKEG